MPDTSRSGSPRIFRLSLRSFCSSSVSSVPSETIDPASGITSKAIVRTYLFGSGKFTEFPSYANAAMSWVIAASTWVFSSATPASPLPDTAWKVVTITRCNPANLSNALSTGIAAMVVQLGLAIMPFFAFLTSSGFTSLTTSGTSGSMRQAEELSITVAPEAANFGASSFEVPPPAEKIAMSIPERSAVAASSTTYS